jgi:hypothetical protein
MYTLIYTNICSGKTTLLRKFGDVVEPVFPTDRALIEHSSFKKLQNRQEAEELLSSCVLTSKVVLCSIIRTHKG